MKRHVYLSYIHSDAMNFKHKILDRFKGRKYKISEEGYDVKNTTIEPNEETLTQLAKNVSHQDVTVVLISRNILESKWIAFEVEASLDTTKIFSRKNTPKGVIGVVIPDKGNDYSYMMKKNSKGVWLADKSKLPTIISANMHNEKVLQNKNNVNYDSFISVYRWEDFVRDYDNCINIAYEKANSHHEDYNITL